MLSRESHFAESKIQNHPWGIYYIKALFVVFNQNKSFSVQSLWNARHRLSTISSPKYDNPSLSFFSLFFYALYNTHDFGFSREKAAYIQRINAEHLRIFGLLSTVCDAPSVVRYTKYTPDVPFKVITYLTSSDNVASILFRSGPK